MSGIPSALGDGSLALTDYWPEDDPADDRHDQSGNETEDRRSRDQEHAVAHERTGAGYAQPGHPRGSTVGLHRYTLAQAIARDSDSRSGVRESRRVGPQRPLPQPRVFRGVRGSSGVRPREHWRRQRAGRRHRQPRYLRSPDGFDTAIDRRGDRAGCYRGTRVCTSSARLKESRASPGRPSASWISPIARYISPTWRSSVGDVSTASSYSSSARARSPRSLKISA